MKRAALLALALVLVPLAGCDGELDITTPSVPQLVTGEWEGATSVGFVEMVLAEDVGGRISGAGTLRRANDSFAFEVTGANAFPDVSLTLKFGPEAVRADTLIGAQFVNYEAEFDEEDDGDIDLVGFLNGGSLRNVPLRLDRDD